MNVSIKQKRIINWGIRVDLLSLILLLVFLPLFFEQVYGKGDPALGQEQKIENQLLELMNRDRARRGLPPLGDNEVLGSVSLAHSHKMAGEGKLEHRFPGYKRLGKRLKDAGLYFMEAGENVALSGHLSALLIHEGFMDSPSHRENILDSNFTHCAVRVVTRDRELYVTQEFARLFTPLDKEKIAIELREDFSRWYKKKFRGNLILFEQYPGIRAYAQYCARQNLFGRELDEANEKWGSFKVHTLIHPDLKKVLKKLKKKAKKDDFLGAEIGVAFGKNSDFPGGTYSVSLILFPTYKYWDKSDKKLNKYVLKSLNKARAASGGFTMRVSKKLSKEAWDLAKRYYDDPGERFGAGVGKQVLVFQTSDPRKIPQGLLDAQAFEKKNRKVGVGVFSPLKYSLPGSFFIIALVITTY